MTAPTTHPSLAVLRADARATVRQRWFQGLAAAGVVMAVLVGVAAANDSGQARVDALRAGSAGVLLLAGLGVALFLGSTAFVRDARTGYLGLLVGTGATPAQVGAGRLGVRVLGLVGIIAVWGVALQLVAVALGEGPDGQLAVHTLTMLVNLTLVLCASAALGSVIGAVAAGAFGVMVFISAQAAVNLKAAHDQGAIETGSTLIDAMYLAFPRAVVSSMVRDMQLRDVGGPAAPQVDVNGFIVIVPPSPAITWAWTLLWAAGFAMLALVGLRRRQL